jgi:excinuclease ABC subunit C
MEKISKILSKLPDASGVYFFKGSAGKILYVGKATSLRDRVRSYFSSDIAETRGPLILKMLTDFKLVDFIQTDSVLEALILEASLIKKHQPPYNTKEKDNKSFNYVVFTKEDFPKIFIVRGRSIASVFPKEKIKYIFGPFPHGAQLKEAIKIIRKIFPFSDKKCKPPRPCFNRQIGLCPGVCTGEITKKEYAETIKNLRLFFEAKKKVILRNLEKQMEEFARSQQFEKAGMIKKTIFALNHIQDIALLKNVPSGDFNEKDLLENFRVEAYDVAHLNGTNVVGVMTVVENGQISQSEYRKFKIKINPGINDTAALKEILTRRFEHAEWTIPNLIVVDGAQAQINVAKSILKKRRLSIDVVSVVKDDKHKAREILGEKEIIKNHNKSILLANSEAHRFAINFHRKIRKNNFK